VKKAKVYVHDVFAGILESIDESQYRFTYQEDYQGVPVSLTMPVKNRIYEFNEFPAFFEGLLPEGIQLEALLRQYKLDQKDFFGQLLQVGNDTVGAVTIREML
jgi:serine/threonine-protein kinase HipA